MKNKYDLIKFEEGLKLKPYKDTAGKWTIGYGRNLDDNPLNPAEIAAVSNGKEDWDIFKDGITEEGANYLLERGVDKVENILMKELPWFINLDSVRKAAILDMAFNMGIAGLMKWGPTLLLMKNNQWADVVRHIKKSFAFTKLPVRYARISNMFITGQWPKD